MLQINQLMIRQGDFRLGPVDLMLPQGGYGVLTGPTGSGKTTLLETICGLRDSESGQVWLAGIDMTRWTPARRGIGYVPQDSILFPDLSVAQQIGFGLRVRGVPVRKREAAVQSIARQLGIDSLLTRMPDRLSGGERQRVALGRALAIQPRLLCLDEPLSGLDGETRTRLARRLEQLHQQGMTILHVTHNPTVIERTVTDRFEIRDHRVSFQP